MARLLSVNVGLPRDIAWQGEDRPHRRLEGAGSRPAHGTAAQHRRRRARGLGRAWRRAPGRLRLSDRVLSLLADQLGRSDFTYGQFGENFTVEGLSDQEVCIGDRYRVRRRFVRSDAAARHLLPGRHPHERAADGRAAGRARQTRFLFPCAGGRRSRRLATRSCWSPPGPERMSVFEINALLYMPGHPRDQLERALRIPALSARLAAAPSRRCSTQEAELAARRRETPGSLRRPARPGMAGVPPASGLAQGAREQQRDLAGARASGWAPSDAGSARPVRRGTAEAGA